MTGANGHEQAWLAIAMISAPRTTRLVEQSLAELRRGGFTQSIHVFEEPGTDVSPAAGVIVHTHRRRRGLWPNWLSAAGFLLAETDSPFLLVCEDDIALRPEAAESLRAGLVELTPRTFGVASLYTPLHNVQGRELKSGWQTINRGRGTWGALAFCFSRDSLAAILDSQAVYRGGDPAHTDNIIGAGCLEVGRRFYFHYPSLVAHTGGQASTVGHGDCPRFAAVGFDD